MEGLKLTGRLRIENVTQGIVREVDNTIHNVGLAMITNLIGSFSTPTGSLYTHIALGTGSSTINSSDTTLGAETMRSGATLSQQTTSVTNDTLRFIGSFTGDTTETLNEAGIFNNPSANVGSMLSRVVFAGVPVVASDAINVTYNVSFA